MFLISKNQTKMALQSKISLFLALCITYLWAGGGTIYYSVEFLSVVTPWKCFLYVFDNTKQKAIERLVFSRKDPSIVLRSLITNKGKIFQGVHHLNLKLSLMNFSLKKL